MTQRTRENIITALIILAVLLVWFWPDGRDTVPTQHHEVHQ
jgi:hypothetical protein